MSDLRPDFRRVVTTLHHEEPDRVPLAEISVDYEIMSRFLGRPVTDDDLAAQVEFWTQAGYEYIPLTVGMMRPGAVTRDSQISKVIQEVLLKGTADEGSDEAWDIWKRPRLHTEEDFGCFPWEDAARLDFSKFHEVQALLPEGMKIIAASIAPLNPQ